MEGRGVSRFSTGEPSYGYTTETTQFDDALIQHGVITKEQAIMAKGATQEQAQALLQQEQDARAREDQARQADSWQDDLKKKKDNDKTSDNDSDDDSFLDDDDDEFLQQYRQERMQQMEQNSQNNKNKIPTFGQIIPITRSEWQHHVNDASHQAWVLVYLTTSDTERTGRVEQALRELAHGPLRHVKFVTIPVSHALQDQPWPAKNLPTLFCYRHGTLQHQCVGMDPRATAEDVYQLLQEKNVIVTG